MAMFGFNRLIT